MYICVYEIYTCIYIYIYIYTRVYLYNYVYTHINARKETIITLCLKIKEIHMKRTITMKLSKHKANVVSSAGGSHDSPKRERRTAPGTEVRTSGLASGLNICIYIYICAYVHTYVHTYLYAYNHIYII